MITIDYYNSLSNDERRYLRDEILKETGISYSGFYVKLKANRFKILERRKIQEIISRFEHARKDGIL